MKASLNQVNRIFAKSVELILPDRHLKALLVAGSDLVYTELRDGPLTPESELIAEGIDFGATVEDMECAKIFYATRIKSLISYHKVVRFAESQS